MAIFDLNPRRRCALARLGEDRAPLLVVDDAFAEPEALVLHARSLRFQEVRGEGNHFPGVRAPLPGAYAEAMAGLLGSYDDIFGALAAKSAEVMLNHAQMVTTPPPALTLPQRLPHFDTFDPGQVAFLHYLTSEDFGGTDFYRHRSTGFERIMPERFRHYTATLAREIMQDGHPSPDYIRGSTERFVCTHSVEPRFNRVIAYFSNSLHSGHIRKGTELSADPARGRLMASVFVRFA